MLDGMSLSLVRDDNVSAVLDGKLLSLDARYDDRSAVLDSSELEVSEIGSAELDGV